MISDLFSMGRALDSDGGFVVDRPALYLDEATYQPTMPAPVSAGNDIPTISEPFNQNFSSLTPMPANDALVDDWAIRGLANPLDYGTLNLGIARYGDAFRATGAQLDALAGGGGPTLQSAAPFSGPISGPGAGTAGTGAHPSPIMLLVVGLVLWKLFD